MEKIRQSPDYYDRMFAAGGHDGMYELPYRHSTYYPLFLGVLGEVLRARARSVLEVGCGTGSFAHLLMDRTTVTYAGFDFSAVAVEKARQRTGKAECFCVADATRADSTARVALSRGCGLPAPRLFAVGRVVRSVGPRLAGVRDQSAEPRRQGHSKTSPTAPQQDPPNAPTSTPG